MREEHQGVIRQCVESRLNEGSTGSKTVVVAKEGSMGRVASSVDFKHRREESPDQLI